MYSAYTTKLKHLAALGVCGGDVKRERERIEENLLFLEREVQLVVDSLEHSVQVVELAEDAVLGVVHALRVQVSVLGHEVDEAEEGVGLCELSRLLAARSGKHVVDGTCQLVHSLQINNTTPGVITIDSPD